MKILFLVNNPHYLISHRLNIVKCALNNNFEVHIAAPAASELKHVFDSSVILHDIELHRKSINPLREFKALFQIYGLYKTIKPDIVHQLTIKPVIYGGLVARITNVPCVVNAISGLGYAFVGRGLIAYSARKIAWLGYRLAFAHGNMKVILQNKDDFLVLQNFVALRQERVSIIIGTGIDLDKFSPLPVFEGTPTVIFAARLLWDKGLAEFVSAARILQKRMNIRFALVGNIDMGNPSSVDRDQIQNWCNEGVIEWWGWYEDIREAFVKANIICLPSYREGSPRVLIEAAACAKAIVTTDVPGCRDVVKHNENGLLIPAKNSKALAKAIEKLANDRELRKKMGRQGRLLVEKSFSEKFINTKTFDVYEELLKNYKSKCCS